MKELRHRLPLSEGLGWATLSLALALRWPWPAPEWFHVDERAFAVYPLGFWSGDFNPHFFSYPTFTLYIASALYYVYYLLCSAQSLDYFIAYRYLVDPSDLLAIARAANTLVSAATVAVCMQIGGRLYGRTMGHLTGLLLAVMPLHARFAHLAITDVASGFFTALAVLYAVRIVQGGGRGDLALAGVWAGLAAASKYPAGLALVPALVACALSRRWRRAAWVPVAAAALSFVATNPYCLLDWDSFRESLGGMAGEHVLGDRHAGGSPAWWHWLHHNLRYGLGWSGLAALAAALGWRGAGWRREEWVVLGGAAVFLALFFAASSVYMRYAQPLVPLLAVLMARSAALLAHRRGWLAAWLALVVSEPLYDTLRQRALLAGGDTRIQARAWLAAHAPQGQRLIAIPGAADHVPLLSTRQIFVRRNSFIASFGIEGLHRAVGLLARGPELPGLFVPWPLQNYLKAQAGGPAQGEILVLHYQHPIIAAGDEGAPALARIAPAVEWRADFACGDAGGAVFDGMDVHFVPVGNWGAADCTGPQLRVGVMPWYGRAPPTSREFFKAYNLLLAGNEAVTGQRWDEAAAAYRSLIEMSLPLNELFTAGLLYEMLLGIGQALAGLDDHQGAERAWLDAARMKRDETEPYYRLGLIFADLGQYEHSVKYYKKVIEQEPDDAVVLFNLGIGYIQLGLYGESVEVLERAATLAPEVETFLNLAAAYERTGAPARARAALARARALDPGHPRVQAIPPK